MKSVLAVAIPCLMVGAVLSAGPSDPAPDAGLNPAVGFRAPVRAAALCPEDPRTEQRHHLAVR